MMTMLSLWIRISFKQNVRYSNFGVTLKQQIHQKEDVKIKIYLSSTVSFTLSRSSATNNIIHYIKKN